MDDAKEVDSIKRRGNAPRIVVNDETRIPFTLFLILKLIFENEDS